MILGLLGQFLSPSRRKYSYNCFDWYLGKAVKQTTSGECEEREYLNGVLDGEATVIFPDGSKEIRTYAVMAQL